MRGFRSGRRRRLSDPHTVDLRRCSEGDVAETGEASPDDGAFRRHVPRAGGTATEPGTASPSDGYTSRASRGRYRHLRGITTPTGSRPSRYSRRGAATAALTGSRKAACARLQGQQTTQGSPASRRYWSRLRPAVSRTRGQRGSRVPSASVPRARWRVVQAARGRQPAPGRVSRQPAGAPPAVRPARVAAVAGGGSRRHRSGSGVERASTAPRAGLPIEGSLPSGVSRRARACPAQAGSLQSHPRQLSGLEAAGQAGA